MGRLFERWIWGLIIIGVGVVFLLRQLGVLDFEIDLGDLFKTYWPLFLIVPGLRGLLFSRRYSSGQMIGNFILLGIGLVFLAENLDWFDFSWGDLFRFILPIGIILFGLSFLLKSKKSDDYDKKYNSKYDKDYDKDYDQSYRPDYNSKYNSQDPNKYKNNIDEVIDDLVDGLEDLSDGLDDLTEELHDDYEKSKKQGYKFDASFGSSSKDKYRPYGDPYHYVNTDSPKKTINKNAFIGDVHMGLDGYWELQPLNISLFIGDTIIDLTKANIPYGQTKINVSAFIGDVKIFVPHDFDVEVNVIASSFIGDQRVFDRRAEGMFGNTKYVSEYYAEAPRKLKINVSMFIGDVIIKKVG